MKDPSLRISDVIAHLNCALAKANELLELSKNGQPFDRIKACRLADHLEDDCVKAAYAASDTREVFHDGM